MNYDQNDCQQFSFITPLFSDTCIKFLYCKIRVNKLENVEIFSQTFRDFLHFLQNLLNVPTSWIRFIKRDYQVTPRPDGTLNLALSIHYSIKEQI
jgi:hypothetical protein